MHYEKLVGKLSAHALDKSQLSVGHSYSRSKVSVSFIILLHISLLDLGQIQCSPCRQYDYPVDCTIGPIGQGYQYVFDAFA
jgi:hypothetical protein